MTANRRIFVATYVSPEGVARVAKRALCGVRSLYALVIGLFCGRGTLMALGEVDYGLMSGWLAVEMVKYAVSDDGKNGQV